MEFFAKVGLQALFSCWMLAGTGDEGHGGEALSALLAPTVPGYTDPPSYTSCNMVGDFFKASRRLSLQSTVRLTYHIWSYPVVFAISSNLIKRVDIPSYLQVL